MKSKMRKQVYISIYQLSQTRNSRNQRSKPSFSKIFFQFPFRSAFVFFFFPHSSFLFPSIPLSFLLSSRPRTHKHMCLTFLCAEQIHPIYFHCVCMCAYESPQERVCAKQVNNNHSQLCTVACPSCFQLGTQTKPGEKDHEMDGLSKILT